MRLARFARVHREAWIFPAIAALQFGRGRQALLRVTPANATVAVNAMPSSPEYAISRIDLPAMRTHGWQVRLCREGRRLSKFFADRKHGGADLALRAAIEFRDDLLERLPKPPRSGAAGKLTRRNVSGVVGVSRIVVRSAGASYEFWQATWSPSPGVRKRVKFSIGRYGDQEAFDLACRARREGERAAEI